MPLSINLAQMTHERSERPGVGLEICDVKWRKYLQAQASRIVASWKARRVAFDPSRNITRHAVFPETKPQQHQAHLVLTRVRQERVNGREIKFPLFWFKDIPINRDEQCVEVQRSKFRPIRTQEFRFTR